MTNILAAGTRVTTVYQGRESQGAIREGSTEQFAKVEILGLAKRVTLTLPWDAVKKNEYRCFQIVELEYVVEITEVEPKNLHPMNWTGLRESTREGAWAYAGARGKQVVFISREGERKELGQHFSPKNFERAVHAGYVAYGHSMSDGFYAPEKFDSWVKAFRKNPAEHLNHQNDVAEEVKAALPLYLEALKAAGLA